MPKTYTPRRASKRWLANAPAHVLDLFKSKMGTYEVLYTGPLLMLRNKEHGRTMANMIVPGREMGGEPSHPQGIGIWFELDAWGAHEAGNGGLQSKLEEKSNDAWDKAQAMLNEHRQKTTA